MDDWFVEIEGIGSGGKEENDYVGVVQEDSLTGPACGAYEEISVDFSTSSGQDKDVDVHHSCKFHCKTVIELMRHDGRGDEYTGVDSSSG